MTELFNKETGAKIATQPEELPPLREGYIRLVHQTSSRHAESFVENGLIYNKTAAGKEHLSLADYPDVTSMVDNFYENDFWKSLVQEDDLHRREGADAKIIFDMPIEEYWAHTQEYWLDLGGTISRGYLVGVIPNYGTKYLKLSMAEMEQKKAISLNNPLPPFYETPNWKEIVEIAHTKNIEGIQESIDNAFNDENFVHIEEFETISLNSDNNLLDIDDPENTRHVLSEEDLEKRQQRENNKLNHKDWLQEKLDKMREYYSPKEIGTTGDPQTGEINNYHKAIAKKQTKISKEIMLKRKIMESRMNVRELERR